MKRIALLFTALVFVGVSSTACMDKQTEPFKDSGRTGDRNSAPADIIEMPDGFNNSATKCDHGNRIYVTYHGDSAYGSLAVVPNDPTCVGSPN